MATIVPTLFSLVRDSRRGVFDAATFEREVARDFDNQEITQAINRYEQEGKSMRNKEEIRKVIQYIDLTTLNGDDTASKVVALAKRAINPIPTDPSIHCGSVCVYPQRIADVKKFLNATKQNCHITGVAGGFPSGQYHLQSKVLECELSVADGATEIDIVISRASALEEDWKTVHDEVQACKNACGSAHLKTILATGELKTLSNVYKASWASILAGSDFIKTSTGKESVNATLEVAYVMCSAVKRWYELTGKKVGFKPAGGIKTVDEALSYVALVKDILGEQWLNPTLFRIGASSLLDDCLKAL
uniref:deoxyribose-phosphate aldolase n=1 Tax=Caenorhabditis tropicalis TaxID=1561998 RepID=A0A1I7TSZ2_9PELO